jgi:hypothetical protein
MRQRCDKGKRERGKMENGEGEMRRVVSLV